MENKSICEQQRGSKQAPETAMLRYNRPSSLHSQQRLSRRPFPDFVSLILRLCLSVFLPLYLTKERWWKARRVHFACEAFKWFSPFDLKKLGRCHYEPALTPCVLLCLLHYQSMWLKEMIHSCLWRWPVYPIGLGISYSARVSSFLPELADPRSVTNSADSQGLRGLTSGQRSDIAGLVSFFTD